MSEEFIITRYEWCGKIYYEVTSFGGDDLFNEPVYWP